MVRLIKKPTKKLISLCKKYHIKLTVKKGNKRVYKSKRVLMKQIRRRSHFGSWWKPASFGTAPGSKFGKRRKVHRHSRFGECGCGKKTLSFGKKKKSKNIIKLHKICKIYRVKIGKKSPEVLRKQCLKKAMSLLKKFKKV